MCNWKRWIWPGLLATAILTVLAMVFHAKTIEQDLTAKASEALSGDHSWASVSLDGRDLTLTGTAPSEEEQAAAANVAAAAYDVRVVKNGTDLLALADPYTFKAVKNADGVTLTGNVPNDKVRAALVADAEQAMPGIAVTDEMTLARGAPEGFAAIAGFGFSQLAGLTEGEVSLDGTTYSVTGAAMDSDVFETETARANTDIPEGGTLGTAAITAPVLDGPYTFDARKSADGKLELTGYVPSIEMRDSVAAAAAEKNPGVEIENRLKIANGAPEGFDGLVDYGLSQLPKLTSGSVGISGMDYAISGQAADSASYEAAARSAREDLPQGASLVDASIIAPPADGAYTWAATKGPSGDITLTGLMPDEAARERILAKAAELNPAATINDQMQIAAGAPDGFVDAADYSLGYLPAFQAGAASLEGADLTIRGTAPDGDRYDQAALLRDEAPGGVNLATDISLPAAAGAYEVVATKTDNVLVLTGFAPDNAAKARIVAAANGLGSVNVVDRIVVASGVPDGVDWGAAGEFAVAGLSGVTSGTAALRGTALSIDADTADKPGFQTATDAWNAAPPAGTEIATRSIRYPRATPYRLEIAKANSVSLSGNAPSETLLRSIGEEAEAYFGSDIENGIELASGEPRGFEAAASVAIASASRLEGARAVLEDTTLTVSGEALTMPAKIDIERKVANGLPPGFNGVANITVRPAPLTPGGLARLEPDTCSAELNKALSEGSIRFETAKAVIAEASYGLLDKLAYTAQACPNTRLEVGGHTDADGSDEYNMGLSQERAAAVVDYLGKGGVDAARLEAKGYGESSPIASNETAEGKAQNRRIEFRVIQ